MTRPVSVVTERDLHGDALAGTQRRAAWRQLVEQIDRRRRRVGLQRRDDTARPSRRGGRPERGDDGRLRLIDRVRVAGKHRHANPQRVHLPDCEQRRARGHRLSWSRGDGLQDAGRSAP